MLPGRASLFVLISISATLFCIRVFKLEAPDLHPYRHISYGFEMKTRGYRLYLGLCVPMAVLIPGLRAKQGDAEHSWIPLAAKGGQRQEAGGWGTQTCGQSPSDTLFHP